MIGDLPAETTTTWAIEEEAFSLTTTHPPPIITRATEPKAENSRRRAPRPPTETTKVVVPEVIHTLGEITTFPAQTLSEVGIISEREAATQIALVEAAPATTEVHTLIAVDTRAIGLKAETAGVQETIEAQLMKDKIATLEEGMKRLRAKKRLSTTRGAVNSTGKELLADSTLDQAQLLPQRLKLRGTAQTLWKVHPLVYFSSHSQRAQTPSKDKLILNKASLIIHKMHSVKYSLGWLSKLTLQSYRLSR
jgi:hypothetical protein